MVQNPCIEVRGAREHNLKSIDVDIPRNSLNVITGLSGSGKSTLAIDTVYAEGQRRYVESLSAYARQFLDMMDKPDVDSINGLSPAISVEQKTTSRNPRSTVGTITEIHDYLRVLYARAGIPHSPATGLPIEAQQVSDMVKRCLEIEEGTAIHLLAPIVRGRKGEFRKELAELRKAGFIRTRIDGEMVDLDDPPSLAKTVRHDIDLIVDRLRIGPNLRQRLADSFRTALDRADGIAIVEVAEANGEPRRLTFSEKFACPVSGFTVPEIEPRLFSFNSPQGACSRCDGLGVEVVFLEDRITVDGNRGLTSLNIPFRSDDYELWQNVLLSIASHFGVDASARWKDLPKGFRDVILHGTDEKIKLDFDYQGEQVTSSKSFDGVLAYLERINQKQSMPFHLRAHMESLRGPRVCEVCHGKRLRPEAIAVQIAGLDIAQFSDLSVGDALDKARAIPEALDSQRQKVASSVLNEIIERLQFLSNVGLDYLTLSRNSGTLSGGESQRIRLASQIGSGLSGVLYVLDEPSIGLHQRDNRRLLSTLRKLQSLGNSLIVVEHDEEAIREADWVIDMGPGAGRHGGEVVAQGPPQSIEQDPNSLTGRYLSGDCTIPVPGRRRRANGPKIKIHGAYANNLKNIDIAFPLRCFICVTGVSGSGKSTLTLQTLKLNLDHYHRYYGPYGDPINCQKIVYGRATRLSTIVIDQRPIGRTPRSNPATYVGAFTPIREWFAQLPEAKLRGYKPARFSFNVKGGRCEACKGDGLLKIEMHFLSDVYVTCERCKGRRFNDETLEIKFKDLSIADILDMTIEDGNHFFQAVPAIQTKLESLCNVGLGYLKIGQPATTLSGGEAQRVKLSRELAKTKRGDIVYILDEPTTGLHFDDVRKLLEVLHKLVDRGSTVIVIEHNLEVIKTADWVIDLGPEGGDKGGNIVVAGSPEKVAACPDSYTGQWLVPLLAGANRSSKSVQRSQMASKIAEKSMPEPPVSR